MRKSVTIAAGGMLVLAALAGCTATPEAAPTSAAPTPTPTAPCVVGTWTAGADALQPVYDAIPAGLDYPAATIAPEASVVLGLDAAGGFTLTQHVPVTLTWEGHPAAVELGGTMSGAYTTSGATIGLTARHNGLTAEPSDERAASTLFAAATQETLGEWPVSASSFRCAGDELALTLDTEGHLAELRLARRG